MRQATAKDPRVKPVERLRPGLTSPGTVRSAREARAPDVFPATREDAAGQGWERTLETPCLGS